LALGDGLKTLTANLFNIPINYFHNRELKDTPLVIKGEQYTPRFLLHLVSDLGFENNPTLLDLASNCNGVEEYFETYLEEVKTGTAIKKLEPTLFIDYLIEKIKCNKIDNVVVSDVRFTTEFFQLDVFSFKELAYSLRLWIDKVDCYTSEDLINRNLESIRKMVDETIDNNSTKSALKLKVHRVLGEWGMNNV
jgi:hypothetical protein